MQRREVLARIKLVSKVRYLVPLGPRDRICYDPASPAGKRSDAIRRVDGTRDGIVPTSRPLVKSRRRP